MRYMRMFMQIALVFFFFYILFYFIFLAKVAYSCERVIAPGKESGDYQDPIAMIAIIIASPLHH